MKFVASLISLVFTNFVAVVVATFILRFEPISWVLEAYSWSEFVINFFAYLVGAYTGLQVAKLVYSKVAKSPVGPLTAWILVLPFALLGIAEVFVRNNLMGVVGAAGALAGAGMFNGIVRDEQTDEDRQRAEEERSF